MEIFLNGEAKACPEGTTVEGLLDLLKIDKRRTAVELNSHIVPKKSFRLGLLKDADVLEVVTFVGGG